MALRPRINEFVFNHVGTDTSEYVEVKADPGADLSGYRLLVVEGDAGANAGLVTASVTLGTANADGYFVTPFLNNQLQNGAQTLLLVQGYVGTSTTDLDANNDGVLDSTPWSSLVDSIAVVTTNPGDRTYAGAPVLAPLGALTVGGASRIPDGADTDSPADWTPNDFDGAGLPGFTGTPVAGEALNTPGAANQLVGGSTPTPTPTPTAPAYAIHDIQGASQRSPLVGQVVQTSGIVTAVDTTDSGAQNIGYWLQDPNPDNNPATSEAVFVYVGAAANLPRVGDAVTVTGTVGEYAANATNLSVTRLTSPTTVVTSGGNPLPAATVIGQGGRVPPTGVIYNDVPGNLNNGAGDFQPDVEGIDFFESLEGMRVTVNNAVVTQGTNGFDETWVLADNGAGAALRTPRGGVLLQQGDDNPERILFDIDTGVLPGAAVPPAKVGDTFASITGVLSYDFGNYRILPTGQPVLTDRGLRQEVTSLRGDADILSFAEWNVENLDPSDPKFDAIARIIGTNLRTPDIIALQEIQDNNGAVNDGTTQATLTGAKLIAAIQAATGVTYAYADVPPANNTSGGEPGGNIRPGFLYRPDRVQLTGLTTITDSNPADGNAFASSRLPLVGTFRFNGEDVTLINVHYTSKGGSGSSFGANQPPANGGEAARVAQAVETRRVVDALLATNPNARVAVLGDHNEFAWNASQQVFTSDGVLTDLEQLLPANERYTYTFDGNSQALDHTLVTQAMLDVAAFDTVHVNSEFPDATRISDHDPSVTTLSLPRIGAPAPGFIPGPLDANATRTYAATPGQAVTGGAGADIILGAPGTATVAGGGGADLFAFLNGSGGGVITVSDFGAGDQVALLGFAPGAADAAYAGRTVAGGSTTLLLPDNTQVVLSGVTSLSRASIL